jgi:hypothetical protein
MNSSSLLVLVSALLGAAVTSLIGPYLLQTKERRIARAKVITALMKVEKLRWGNCDYSTLQSQIAELKATALMARADRQLIEYYSHLALTSHFSAREETVEENETVRMIPSALSSHIDSALEAVSLTLWHPARTAPFRKLTLIRLKAKEKELKATGNVEIIWRQ